MPGPAASFWAVWGCWRHLLAQGTFDGPPWILTNGNEFLPKFSLIKDCLLFKYAGWSSWYLFIPKERDSGRSRGFAFVRFFDKHDAEVRIGTIGREIRMKINLKIVFEEILFSPQTFTAKQFLPFLGHWPFERKLPWKSTESLISAVVCWDEIGTDREI